MKNILFLTVVIFSLICASCKKTQEQPPETPVNTGVYVLSEGTFMGNNAMLTYYDFATRQATTDYYRNVNGSGLGDTGNDMMIHGGKLYIVMNVSSYVEIADATTARSIRKIDLKSAAGTPLSPRNVIAYKQHVFVSCWDGSVAVIDTSSLAIEKFIRVGANPEQMAISGNRLYVTNSGGVTPGFDSTVSVIDLSTLSETTKIVVGTNPTSIAADDQGNLFVGYTGDYANRKPGLVRISTADNSIVKRADTAVGNIRYYGGKLLASGGFLGVPSVRLLNRNDFSAISENFITDGTAVLIPYGLDVDEKTGDVYIGDAIDYSSDGVMYCFDNNGKKKFSFSVAPGVGPNKTVFVRR